MDDFVIFVIVVVASGAPIAGLAVAMSALARLGNVRRHCRRLEERIDLLTMTSAPVMPEQTKAPDVPAPVVEPHPRTEPLPARVDQTAPVAETSAPIPVTTPIEQSHSEALRRFESSVGKRWITWTGALAVFMGAAFFVKYAMDRGWISPEARVLCGGALGLVMVGGGVRFVLKKMRALGQGLIGGGLGIVYLSIYAAYSLYELVPLPTALGLLAVATAGGMVLAVVHRALPVSLLAAVGGFLTPLLLWTGFEQRDTLFTYLTVLDAGVLGAALLRRWRALDAMAQGVTWTYFTAWYVDAGSAWDPMTTTVWLGVFFVMFAIVPYVRHLKTRTPLTSERVAMAFLGTAIALGCAADLLYENYPQVLGAFALGVGAVQLALATSVRRRIPADRRGLFGFALLAVGSLTAALPGFWEHGALTIGLAAEGVVIVWLAHRLEHLPTRIAALAPIAISAMRVFTIHWPLHYAGDLYTPLLNKEFTIGFAFVLALFGYAGIQRAFRATGEMLDRVLFHVTAHGGAFFGMGLVSIEIIDGLELLGRPHLAHALMPLPWIVGALIYLAWTARCRSSVVRAHGLAVIVIAGVLVAWVYAFGVAPPVSDWLVLNWRCAVSLAGIAVLVGFAMECLRRTDAESGVRIAGAVILGCALGALLTLLSVEVYQFFIRRGPDPVLAERAAQTALSILWGAFAATVLAVGLWLDKRPLRFAALILLGITAVKLVLVDLAVLRDIYRIISFVVLGLVMLSASYLYHKLERRLAGVPAQRQGG